MQSAYIFRPSSLDLLNHLPNTAFNPVLALSSTLHRLNLNDNIVDIPDINRSIYIIVSSSVASGSAFIAHV